MMQAAFPGEAEDTKPDAQPPSYVTQGAQNVPAQPPAPSTQQPSSMACIMPDGRVVYQQRPGAPGMMQPMMVQGQVPGQMMYLPTAQPQQMWPSMQMPYVAPAPQHPSQVVIPEAGVDLRPASFLVMSLIVTFICFFLNITTLIFGIPAIIMSVLCEERKKNAQYGSAKTYGKIALGINIANILYTAAVVIAIIAGVLGGILSSCRGYYYYCNSYYY